MDENARENARQQLLERLNTVCAYLRQITDHTVQRVQLTGSFQGYQDTIQPLAAPKQKGYTDTSTWEMRIKLFLMVFSITVYLTCAARNLLFLETEAALCYAACAVYLMVKRWKKSKIKIVLYLATLYVIPAEIKTAKLYIDMVFGPGYGIVYAALFVLAIVGSLIAVKLILRGENRTVDAENDAQNAQVSARNREIAAQNKKIAAQNKANEQYNLKLCDQIAAVDQRIAELTRAMMEFGAGWYPGDYYDLYAAEQFIAEVANFRAYTVQEMVNIFEQSEHWHREEEGQRQIMSQLGQIHFGLSQINASLGQINASLGQVNANLCQVQQSQAQIIGQLQFANVLQIQKMFQDQWNVEELKKTVRLNPQRHYHYYEIKA